ncbi:MAG: DUF2844 domain-containing protein [Neisseriaceae bacterium]|nr:MAG: DUF2844 domain-containing protein [Neisseriaceae bacterium]
MKNNLKAILLIASISAPLSAWATLGESTSSIMNDAIALKASAPTTSNQSSLDQATLSNADYQTNTLVTQTGIVIKQFSSNGNVFGVAWHGPKVPDQNQLFGKYFTVYQTSTPSYKSLTMRKVNASDFVSSTSGWMGHYEGKAIIPSLAPANVTINSLK